MGKQNKRQIRTHTRTQKHTKINKLKRNEESIHIQSMNVIHNVRAPEMNHMVFQNY